MKIFIVIALLACLFIGSIESKSLPNSSGTQKRLFGSLGSWIDSAINTVTSAVNQVVDVVINPAIDAIGSAANQVGNFVGSTIDQIGSAINGIDFNGIIDTVWNPIQTTVVDGYNNVVSGINTAVDAVGNLVTSIVSPGTGTQINPTEPDFCNLRCKAVNQDGSVFFYDVANGCKAKGFTTVGYTQFHSCCDEHNRCLNSKCCTNNCQALKDDCDANYKRCLRNVCTPIANFDEQDKCTAQANFMSSHATSLKCNPTEGRNRKLCIC